MAMCFGKYSRSVDQKNRIIVPTNFREILGSAIYLVKGDNNRLSVYSSKQWETFFTKFAEYNYEDEEAIRRQDEIIDSVTTSKYDKQGRVALPDEFQNYASIKENAVIVGAGNRIDIWDPETYDEHMKNKGKNKS